MKRHEQRCFGSKTARCGQGYEGHELQRLAANTSNNATRRSAASILASVDGRARQTAPVEPPLTFVVRATGSMIGKGGGMASSRRDNRMVRVG